MHAANNPFRLPLKPQWLMRQLEKLLGLNTLATIYDRRPHPDAQNPADHVADFMASTLEQLKADVTFTNASSLENIPTTGATILVSNHPLGGLEGVAMAERLLKIRPDLKVLTNQLLSRIPEFSDLFVGVDILSNNGTTKNSSAMRKIFSHLKNGHALLIYPAGMVSAINLSKRRIEDRAWTNIVGRLVKLSQATCVPFYVHGRNSQLFYLAGLIHPRLRTLMLPRELANKANSHTSITVGSPITWKDIQSLDSPDDITAYLRTATDLLNENYDANEPEVIPNYNPIEPKVRNQEECDSLQHALNNLSESLLIQQGDFDVYCARHEDLGILMHELAIAREITFRAAGEGTGFESDSDNFDTYYDHLFIWDREKMAIVGSYRIGCVDKILEKHGVEGLYSRSLYQFDEEYVRRLGQAIEVGRSFISPDYQRNPKALDLLWRGIGQWVVNNPGYHTLFGCVSISSEHSARARAFLKDSLMASFRAKQEFLTDVRPIAPLKVSNVVWTDNVLKSLSNIKLINKLLGQCDPGKRIPVLLRHYLALNGRIVCFTVNHGFNNSLDGLIIVDLRETPAKYLKRYLGDEGMNNFKQQWSIDIDAA